MKQTEINDSCVSITWYRGWGSTTIDIDEFGKIYQNSVLKPIASLPPEIRELVRAIRKLKKERRKKAEKTASR